jgi:hypothetical protein
VVSFVVDTESTNLGTPAIPNKMFQTPDGFSYYRVIVTFSIIYQNTAAQSIGRKLDLMTLEMPQMKLMNGVSSQQKSTSSGFTASGANGVTISTRNQGDSNDSGDENQNQEAQDVPLTTALASSAVGFVAILTITLMTFFILRIRTRRAAAAAAASVALTTRRPTSGGSGLEPSELDSEQDMRDTEDDSDGTSVHGSSRPRHISYSESENGTIIQGVTVYM